MRKRQAKKILRYTNIVSVCSNDFKEDLGKWIMTSYPEHTAVKALRHMKIPVPKPEEMYREDRCKCMGDKCRWD